MNQHLRMRRDLPYGEWTCADGRRVLFNRDYRPIWEQLPGDAARPASPNEWVRFTDQRWFYNDYSPPSRSPKTRAHCTAVLREWGVA